MTEKLERFGDEWIMCFAAHRAAGKSKQAAELNADETLRELRSIKLPVGSIWESGFYTRIKIVWHDDLGGVQVEGNAGKWFESCSTLLDKTRWVRIYE